jgi:anti-sigma B factor antagonist
MSFTFDERQIGDVTIVDMKGRMTLSTGSGEFRDLIRNRLLAAGRTKIILNMSRLQYNDSSGLGEIVSAYTSVRRAGGSLKLLSLGGNLKGQLQITKLYTVFEIFDDERVAVESFLPSTSIRYCRCPICRTRMTPPSIGGANWDLQTCLSCGARARVGGGASSDAVPVLEVEVPTYDGEYFHVSCDRPVTVSVVGRLDSFASTALARLWSAVPSPKRVVFHLDQRAELSVPGWTKLMALTANAVGADRAAVLLDSAARVPEELRDRCASAAGVYAQRTAAVGALGEPGGERPWLAQVD